MQIVLDTNQSLSDTEKAVLRTLLGESGPTPVTEPAGGWSEGGPEEKPAKKSAPAKKAAPKKQAKPDPEPEPDEDEAEADEPEVDDLADADEDAPTMDDAIRVATELVSDGKAAQVKEALAELGAKRVSELSADDVPAFLQSLGK